MTKTPARREFIGANRLPALMSLVLTVIAAAGAAAQMDTTRLRVPPNNLATSPSRPSGGLAFFVGFQQGIHTSTGEGTSRADWVLGASPDIPLGESWELSPELALWHMNPTENIAVADGQPSGVPAIGEKWKWYPKLGLHVRWFPLASGRLSAYAIGGPAYFSYGDGALSLDLGGGVCCALSRSLALVAETRTYFFYSSSASSVLTSPVSFTVGIRWAQARQARR